MSSRHSGGPRDEAEKEGPALTAPGDPPCLAITTPVALADPVALCERARDLLERDTAEVLVCDVSAVEYADLGIVDVLARVRLTARRLGCAVLLRRASVDLVELVALIGLRSELPIEVEGQAEEREEARGIEEEGDAGDPAA